MEVGKRKILVYVIASLSLLMVWTANHFFKTDISPSDVGSAMAAIAALAGGFFAGNGLEWIGRGLAAKHVPTAPGTIVRAVSTSFLPPDRPMNEMPTANLSARAAMAVTTEPLKP